jgi:transcriptional regulator with XRE-family HTH domain
MNSRVRELRKALNLSGDKFGKRIGVSKTAVSKIELGRAGITESIIKLICSEFGVNEAWLRTGDGPMLLADTNGRFAALFGKTLASGSDFKKELLTAIMELDEEQMEALEKIVYKFAETKDKEK